jgi:DNA adenine methylase
MDIRHTNQPFIKWTGSKRSQAERIVGEFPEHIETYYEGFCGGCSVMHELLNQIYEGKRTCSKIVCSDLNKDLIYLFNMLLDKEKRWELYRFYCDLRDRLVRLSEWTSGEITRQHVANCQDLYYQVREEYNEIEHGTELSAMMFYWITRNSINGLIRYNKNTGRFNASFHVSGRFGISAEKLKKVIESWALVMDDFVAKGGTIEFLNQSYDDTIKDAKTGDVVYLDPPYANIEDLYFGTKTDIEFLVESIKAAKKRGSKVILSFDGKRESGTDMTVDVGDWWDRHEYLDSGNSPFRNTKGIPDMVYESLYIG